LRGGKKALERWYNLWKRYTVHPNLRVDYFHTIDTKEKAYWLGFLYADGFVRRYKMRIGIHLNRGDEETIDRFCGCLGLDRNKRICRVEDGKEYVEISFACKEMGNDLIKQGVVFRKSKIIEYPKLLRTEFDFAFLLGYYDGDGVQNTTIILSGNKRFLEQVKSRFELPYKIQVVKHVSEIHGRKVEGTEYSMCLGAELFNDLMDNYENSMPRKRWFPCDSREKARRAAEASTSEMKRIRMGLQRNWRAITNDELEKMVWQMPSERIAAIYGVTGKTVERRCRKFRILKPKRGYWQKVRFLQEKSIQDKRQTPFRRKGCSMCPYQAF
jgi:hypothetical protein